MTALVSELRILDYRLFFLRKCLAMSHKTRLKSASDAAKEGQKFCKTGKFEIFADEVDFHCFSCGVNFHLTKGCTALNDAVLLGVKELGNNALLLCNDCVAQKQRDWIIESAAKIQQPKDDKQLKSLQIEVTEIKKAKSELKESFVKQPIPKQTHIGAGHPTPKKTVEAETPEGIRVRGVRESTSKLARERNEHDMKEISDLMTFLSMECEITEIKRIGPYQEGRARTIVFTVANKFHRRLILLSIGKLKEYDKLIFVSKELNAEEAKQERLILKKRREKVEAGILRKELKIRDLKLYKKDGNDWIEVKNDEELSS